MTHSTQMMMMHHQQSTQMMMMHPQSCRVMKKKRQQISKRNNTTTPTPTPTPTPTSEPSLPCEIIFFHILPKLPVRSLLRFNCVSKLWYNTIHHPKFHASQLSHAKSNPSLVAMLCQKATFICFLQLKEGGGNHHHHHHPNSSSIKNNNIASLELESGSGLIVGTCNGLTCNRIPSGIQICNPSTRELLNFPDSKPTTLMERNAAARKGFGFDPLMNEYKVIHLRFDYHGYYDCRVYTLGTNRWRNVTATCNYPPYCYPDDTTPISPISRGDGAPFWNVELAPICISGILFWKTNRKGRILSFDLHHEKFHLIAGPNVPQELTLHTLFDLEGRLCLVYRYDDDLKDQVQLTLITCKDHQQLRLVHTASSSAGGVTWIRSWYMCLPLKPEIKLIRFVEFAKHIYLHWVTMDGRFILWEVNRKRWIHNKLLGLDQTQWVLLVNHVENLLSLKTFVPPSAGEVEVKYFSSRDAKHEIPDGEMKKKKRRRIVYDSNGYRTTPYWLSIII